MVAKIELLDAICSDPSGELIPPVVLTDRLGHNDQAWNFALLHILLRVMRAIPAFAVRLQNHVVKRESDILDSGDEAVVDGSGITVIRRVVPVIAPVVLTVVSSEVEANDISFAFAVNDFQLISPHQNTLLY